MEQVTPDCGMRTIQRVLRNSLKTYVEIKLAANLDSCILMPVLFEKADCFLGQLEEDMRETLDGVMLFGGQ